MDQELVKIAGGNRLRVVDAMAGSLEIDTPEGLTQWTLKPLGELYGNGVGAATVDPLNERYMPLFYAIEEGIVELAREDRTMTDARALLALERLGMSPEGEAGNDVLVKYLQFKLRMVLSMNDYSRQEVKAAAKKIARSVERHTKLAGPHGYLMFIRRQLRM